MTCDHSRYMSLRSTLGPFDSRATIPPMKIALSRSVAAWLFTLGLCSFVEAQETHVNRTLFQNVRIFDGN